VTDRRTIVDEEHLRLLSLFHYVSGGLTCLYALIPLIHVGMGLLMMLIGVAGEDEGTLPALVMGSLFAGLGALVVGLGLAFGIAKILAGRAMANRRRYGFCVTVAVIECLGIPYGTILGVCTLVVLFRDSVKRRF
jgi:hypothetical protein